MLGHGQRHRSAAGAMSVEYVVLLAVLALTLAAGAFAYGVGLSPLFTSAGSSVTAPTATPPVEGPPPGSAPTPPSDDAAGGGQGGGPKQVPACGRRNPPPICP